MLQFSCFRHHLCSLRPHLLLVRSLAAAPNSGQQSNSGKRSKSGKQCNNGKQPKKPVKQRLKSGKLMGSKDTFTVAIEGCCHGELDNIYGALQHLEQKEKRKIDLLICCGDFQAVRNLDDLECLACPPKYRKLMTFYKYYSGEKKAPIPTLFIGGNHEATNFLWELHYGGWTAPNIYFMGYSGVVNFGGHRIAGLSGVYVQSHYKWGYFEQPPYDDKSIKSAYHVRQLQAYKLAQLQKDVDIFLSHDWPRNIVEFGNKQQLLEWKPFLRKEIAQGEFGSVPAEELMHELQPLYWFAAHMHTKFPAVVQHPGGNCTKFLALDKCLPNREFLQILELPRKGPLEFSYDAEWLAVLRSTHHLLGLKRNGPSLPAYGAARNGASQEDLEYVERVLSERGASIPHNFQMTAPAHGSPGVRTFGRMPKSIVRNPQTVQLLEMLGLPYNLDAGGGATGQWAAPAPVHNPEEIDIDDAEEEEGDVAEKINGTASAGPTSNPDVDAGQATTATRGEEQDEMFQPLRF